MVQSLLSKYHANINLTDSHSMSPLLYACATGEPGIVTYLLSHGADANHKTSSGKDVFAMARMHGHMNVIQKLVEAGYKDTNTEESVVSHTASACYRMLMSCDGLE